MDDRETTRVSSVARDETCNWKNRFLHVTDNLLCCFVFFPATVFYWRGIWDLYGVYILPGVVPGSSWAIFGLGAGTIVGYLVLPFLNPFLRKLSRVWNIILSRVFMYFYAVCFMAYWRGVWELGDYYLLPFGRHAIVAGYLVVYILLMLLQVSRSTTFPPFIVLLDTREDVLVPSTRFGIKPTISEPRTVLLYILDSVFTHFVIFTLVILNWQCLWGVIGIILPFEDELMKDWVAFGIGWIGTFVVLCVEEGLAKMSLLMEKKYKYGKIVWETAVYFCLNWVTVMLWRGGWNLNTRFMIVDTFLGGWVNHGVGTVLLMSCQIFSCVGACGCVINGSDPGREGIFPMKFLRHYLKKPPPAENDETYLSKTNVLEMKEDAECKPLNSERNTRV